MKKWGYLILISVVLISCGSDTIDESVHIGNKVDALIDVPADEVDEWNTIKGSEDSTILNVVSHGEKMEVTAYYQRDKFIRLKTAHIIIDSGVDKVNWVERGGGYIFGSKMGVWKKHTAVIDKDIREGRLYYVIPRQKDSDELITADKFLRYKGRPAINSGAPNRLDIFAQNHANRLIVVSSTDNGRTWPRRTYLGGFLASDPAVASLGPNHLDVHVRGDDNQLWHRWWNGQIWSPWLSLGGVLKSGPAVAVKNGKLDVVVYGDDGDLWRKTFDGRNWLEWKRLGSGPKGVGVSDKLKIAAIDDHNLTVFVSGEKGTIYYKTFCFTDETD